MTYHNISKGPSNVPTTVSTKGQVAPKGYHYMPSGTLMADVDHTNLECNEIYYHLFSMCHSGLDQYKFQQGSVVVWEGSPNFISRDCTSKNLLVNNTDFYLSAGQPSVGQSVGIKDNVGLSCMVYVGFIPYPIVNPVKLTKLVNSTNVYEDCSTCVNLAVKGCTESEANNYNRLATIDDGSCKYSNLPCKGCCVSQSGKQYTPTQPCICESGYSLSKLPCVVTDKPCEVCCYSKTKGIYHPSNEGCFCEKGDTVSKCKEVKEVVGECTNCCTNKSGALFSPKRSLRYGCSCVSGSWLTPCDGEDIISNTEITPATLVTHTTSTISSPSTIDTCEGKIDSNFNETLSHLPISNHLDSIYKLSGGVTNPWSMYKFKHYPISAPKKTDGLCLAVDSWSGIQDAYWVYVKNIKLTYTPLGSHEETKSSNVTSFSELYGWSADTLSKIGVVLDNTKDMWKAMELWNNDTTIWTPGVFSMEYNLVYCDCSGGVSPDKETIGTTVAHVFGGTKGTYIVKVDNLTNYKCVSGTNPLVAEVQQTCVPTEDPVSATVYDNINSCINSGCAGYMTCNGGVSVDGILFGKEKSYTPIVMCCEKLITNSKEKLTRDICQSQCGAGEIWYPLYNAFAPNLMFDSLLGYMTRDLLNKVNNYECKVSKDATGFKASGLVEKTK